MVDRATLDLFGAVIPQEDKVCASCARPAEWECLRCGKAKCGVQHWKSAGGDCGGCACVVVPSQEDISRERRELVS